MASSSDRRASVEGDWGESFPFPYRRDWYDRPTLTVARDLLGAVLLRRTGRRVAAVRLVETEAYTANDPASHAYRGLSPRNRSMFGRPGTLYVYRIHQVHCANVVTRKGEAVLLRAGEPIDPTLGATRGPGRLCGALGITREQDGTDLVRGPIRIVPGGKRRWRVVRGPRIGIRQNAEAPFRFALSGNLWVSHPRPVGWKFRRVI